MMQRNVALHKFCYAIRENRFPLPSFVARMDLLHRTIFNPLQEKICFQFRSSCPR
jgi:hypothetical protein